MTDEQIKSRLAYLRSVLREATSEYRRRIELNGAATKHKVLAEILAEYKTDAVRSEITKLKGLYLQRHSPVDIPKLKLK